MDMDQPRINVVSNIIISEKQVSPNENIEDNGSSTLDPCNIPTDSDFDLVPIRKKTKAIIDSDTDNELEESVLNNNPRDGKVNLGNNENDGSGINLENGLNITKESSPKTTHRPRVKRLAIIDSDSEEDIVTPHNTGDHKQSDRLLTENAPGIIPNGSQSEQEINKDVADYGLMATNLGNNENAGSDINHENGLNITKEHSPKTTYRPRLKRLAIIDSDSEEDIATTHNTGDHTQSDSLLTENAPRIILNGSQSEQQINKDVADYGLMVSRVTALCDEESDNEEDLHGSPDYDNSQEAPSFTKTKKPKKFIPKGNTEQSVEKKMTAKQALQQRQEIKSASQRRVREMTVSLPYHKPKAHSIKEFLQNRPRLSLSLIKDSVKTPASVALKMSTQQLEIVTKNLEERVKVVQQFYMSESESEDEDDDDDVSNVAEETVNSADVSELTKHQEECSLEKDDVPSSSDAPTILQSENEGNIDEVQSNTKTTENNIAVESQTDIAPFKIFDSTDARKTHETPSMENILVYNDIQSISPVGNKSNEDTVENGSINDEIPDVEMIENIPVCAPITDLVLQTSALIQNCAEEVSIINVSSSKTDDLCLTLDNTPKEMLVNMQVDGKYSESEFLDASKEECPSNLPFTDSEIIPNGTMITTEKDPVFDDAVISDELQNSDNVDFNLDDVDTIPNQQPCIDIEEDHLQRLLKKYSSNTPNIPETDEQPKVLSKLELLKQKLGDFKPCLSGSPDEDIDLEQGVIKPNAISLLRERFMKHITNPKVRKANVQVDVINLTQGEIRHETVAVTVDPEEEPSRIMEKPGQKLRKLRLQLQTQMAQRRSELWQQKLQMDKDKTVNDTLKDVEDKSDFEPDVAEDILDDEEEAELTDGDVTDEEEDEENDEDAFSEISEKRPVNSVFIDGEAEETDADDEYEEDGDDNEPEPDEQEDHIISDNDTLQTKKPLKRILKGFTEDSDDEESSVVTESYITDKVPSCMDGDIYDYDEPIPPNQPRLDITPHKSPTHSPSDVEFLTPALHFSGLPLNSGSKFLQESPASPLALPQHSVFHENNRHIGPQKKLFSGSFDTLDTQSNLDNVAQLCSGNFPASFDTTSAVGIPTTQDLLNICSGSFPEICISKKVTDKCLDVNTQNTKVCQEPPSSTEIKTLDEDKLILELLDEEEMEQFKKKFESPIEPHINTTIIDQDDSEDEVQEVQGGGFIVSDSSDDENSELKSTFTKKLKKKLYFSDDDSSENGDDNDGSDEDIDLHDKISDGKGDEDDLVEYDSEENEIDMVQNDANRMKLTDFLENEAELSESEWGSADEDERGLDILETEQGDADVFDENKMRSDLEKIHMRRVLDQDTHEIKILQELLLEGGELHGTGRQRQFRWKNMDDGGADQLENNSELDIYLDEEESEEQWRRARHQREMFLKKNQDKVTGLDEDNFISSDSNSQVIQLGQEAVRKSLSNPTTADQRKGVPDSPEVKRTSMFMHTRGSFLARTDKFLTKLAEFTKVSTETIIKTSKNPKTFVFQTLSTEDRIVTNEKKRKAADNTPSVIKKLRLSKDNTSPATVNSKKKLFY